MREDEKNNRKSTPDEALSGFLSFIDDPMTMDEEELNDYLSDAGLNFVEFDVRLSKDIELATKRARLVAAKESRDKFVQRTQGIIGAVAMTIEEKRTEIQRRLGLLGGQAAGVFNRSYESAEDEEDLDSLLADLRALDERAKENGHEP